MVKELHNLQKLAIKKMSNTFFTYIDFPYKKSLQTSY